MQALDLFSGIGGFALACKWAGIETKAFCEIDSKATKVLVKRFPNIPIFKDVTKFDGKQFKSIDLICGGFPCQDISAAGNQAGIEGKRSGLWFEMHRIVDEARPNWILIENVASLRDKGFDRIADGLAEIGYTATPSVVGAWTIGASHPRERAWIVGYPEYNGRSAAAILASYEKDVLDYSAWEKSASEFARASNPSMLPTRIAKRGREPFAGEQPRTKSRLGRADDGFSARMDRIKQLGNTISPHIAYLFLRFIVRADSMLKGLPFDAAI